MRIGSIPAKFAIVLPKTEFATVANVEKTRYRDKVFDTAIQEAKYSPNFTSEQLQALYEVLFENRYAFASGDRQLGEAQIKPLVLDVDLPDPIPAKLRQRP